MMDWEDLRIFREVARVGSLSAAAKTLGVNQSTVSRRLRSFEERAKVKLLDRSPSGYTLTDAGLDMMLHVERMATEVESLDRILGGHDGASKGIVRLTYPLGLQEYITPMLVDFRNEHPEISLELISSNEVVNLAQRHADIAIRVSSSPPETLVGRKVAEIAFAPYAAIEYLEGRAAEIESIEEMDWLAYHGEGSDRPVLGWIRDHVALDKIVMKTRCSSTLQHATQLGMGACFLPCILGDSNPLLRRIGDESAEFHGSLWLLTHEELRRSARIRTLLDFLAQRLNADKERLSVKN